MRCTLGPPQPRRMLVMTSGTHGAELMCGSGCQVGHVITGKFDGLPNDCGVLLLHALNPWGAANLRRNTEDNVDLCRNFMAFDKSLPVNHDYEQFHAKLSAASFEEVDQLVAEGVQALGMGGFMNALMGGAVSLSRWLLFRGH